MTSSFVKILARHRGPYRLVVALTPDAKGKRLPSEWIPTKTKDPVSDALELLTQMGGAATSVQAWSEYEEQFVLTIVEADRAVWEAEKPTWEEDVKAARKEVDVVAAKPIRIADGISAAQIARVLELRATGLGYVHIETDVLGPGNEKKGFWAWKIVKASQKDGSNA